MTVILSPDASRFVDEQVKAGRYTSAEAAIDAAVARLRTDAMSGDDADELRSLLDVGLAEADRAEFVDFTAESVIAERRAALTAGQGRA